MICWIQRVRLWCRKLWPDKVFLLIRTLAGPKVRTILLCFFTWRTQSLQSSTERMEPKGLPTRWDKESTHGFQACLNMYCRCRSSHPVKQSTTSSTLQRSQSLCYDWLRLSGLPSSWFTRSFCSWARMKCFIQDRHFGWHTQLFMRRSEQTQLSSNRFFLHSFNCLAWIWKQSDCLPRYVLLHFFRSFCYFFEALR